ncbi:ATP-binding cassette domain-containing protein, partial [Mesorhizobium sp. M00.F.Ca.ET.170.01.1.1]
MSETFRRQFRKLLPTSAPKAVAARGSDLPAPIERAAGPALTIEGLTVRYGSVVALNNVSLNVAAGAVAGLIGPNGAGKSTFIDAVAGFLSSYQGSVRLG